MHFFLFLSPRCCAAQAKAANPVCKFVLPLSWFILLWLLTAASVAFAAGAEDDFVCTLHCDFRNVVWAMPLDQVKLTEKTEPLGEELLLDDPPVLLLNYQAGFLGLRGRLGYFFADQMLFAAAFMCSGAPDSALEQLRLKISADLGKPLAYPGNKGWLWSGERLRVSLKQEQRQPEGQTALILWIFPSQTVLTEKFEDYQDIIAVQPKNQH
ncbi:MAG: hypothetical protein IJD04_07220 [Desulfovibrionaceae bacterium]|nr:hypothetical protein [Desulfovibrionaceae bacterium]